MTDEKSRSMGVVSLLLVVVSGALLIAVAFIVKDQEVAFPVLLSIGAALEAAVAVALIDRFIPPRRHRNKIVVGHSGIYDEFGKMLDALDSGKPHVIRTINSCPPEVGTEDKWDTKVVHFLKENPQTQFIRLILYQETNEWSGRLDRITERYAGIPNYHQHKHVAPATIEMFLVDKTEVLLSFATPELPTPSVTYGVRIRDLDLCEQLETYHRIQLEQRVPRDVIG